MNITKFKNGKYNLTWDDENGERDGETVLNFKLMVEKLQEHFKEEDEI